MSIKGIDVSSYQGTIDWKKAKSDGVEFAILKVIRKDLKPDKQFESNWNGCIESGIPVQGVYNYSYASTEQKAISDAKQVISILNGRKPMVWLDVEDSVQKNIGVRLADIINSYGNVIRSAGLQFGVYTGLSFYNSYIKPYADEIKNVPFWIARYPSDSKMRLKDTPAASKKPDILHELWGWQYSSKGSVNGISGNVDMNEFYVLENPSNVMPEPEKTEGYSLRDFVRDVQSAIGAKVDGIAGTETLSKTVTVSAGINRRHKVVKPIQKRLNEIGFNCGTVDGIAGSKFTTAVKAFQKANGCVSDGEITAKKNTWKKLLGMK